jgi:hypothetical protein
MVKKAAIDRIIIGLALTTHTGLFGFESVHCPIWQMARIMNQNIADFQLSDDWGYLGVFPSLLGMPGCVSRTLKYRYAPQVPRNEFEGAK